MMNGEWVHNGLPTRLFVFALILSLIRRIGSLDFAYPNLKSLERIRNEYQG